MAGILLSTLNPTSPKPINLRALTPQPRAPRPLRTLLAPLHLARHFSVFSNTKAASAFERLPESKGRSVFMSGPRFVL